MNYNKKTVMDVDVSGKKVLLRCDFNVPQVQFLLFLKKSFRILKDIL